MVQKSHDEFYILISSLELQKTTCLTTCSSFPWLDVLWVMCSNEFQIVLLCTNHTLVKPILNLAKEGSIVRLTSMQEGASKLTPKDEETEKVSF